jgi:two-component system LytT family sensor kinase
MATSFTENRHRNLNHYKTKWIHIAFWVVVTIIFLFDRTYLIQKRGLPNFIECAVVRISLLVGIAYLNLYYFMPKFLLRGKYFGYFVMVILSILGYIFIQSIYDLYLFGYILGPTKRSITLSAISYNILSTTWYLILTVSLKLSIDWYEQNRVLQKIKIEKLQAEVNYLRSQINPHFLFNVLNNLYSLTLKKSELAPDVVLKLSDMMEYMLYESNEAYVPLKKEISYLENYLELEKLRQGNHADIKLNITGTAKGHNIAPFLLLPLVENAFKYGVSKAVDNAYLHINITIEQQSVIFSIENNKLNFIEAGHNSGIGLSNLEERLQLLYPGKHSLQINDRTDKYYVLMKILF